MIALCKGIVAQDTQPDLWQIIRENQQLINEYVAKLGLCLLVDEVDEYAYLKQAEGENSLPRIVPRHQLSYAVSLLIVLLRKHLGEYDASNGDSRLLLTRQKIIASMRVDVYKRQTHLRQPKNQLLQRFVRSDPQQFH